MLKLQPIDMRRRFSYCYQIIHEGSLTTAYLLSSVRVRLVKHRIVRILRPGATINQHQLSRVHCTILEKHIKYTLSVLFPDCYRVNYNLHLQIQPDVAECFSVKQNAKRKAPTAAPCVPGLSFYDWDAMAMMLPKLYWSNLAFLGRTYVFILQSREEASKVDDDKNLCFLLCFKALTDIINWNWRQN